MPEGRTCILRHAGLLALAGLALIPPRLWARDAGPGVMLGCTTEPVAVHPGEIVHVTGLTLQLDPHRETTWTWTANGGKLTQNGAAATIDTTGMAPGGYTVEGHVQQGKRRDQQAACSQPFTIRPWDPPTASCSATPSSIAPGAEAEISASGISPQNRPLTWSYTTTAGRLTASGRTAKLSTGGSGTATITVTCTAVDDLGQSAKAITTVRLSGLVAPLASQMQDLCPVSFGHDPIQLTPQAKGCLDDIALTLSRQPGARLVLTANTAPGERPATAAGRSSAARNYLTRERGIDPNRIELRTGGTGGRYIRSVLVPATPLP